VIVELQD
jgi:hypothetical protein